MAGGKNSPWNSGKKGSSIGQFGNGFFKESLESTPSQQPPQFSLRGVLFGPGKNFESGNQTPVEKTENKVAMFSNHLVEEGKIIADQQEKELKKAIDGLIKEIKKLAKTLTGIEKDAEKIALQPVTEYSEYHLNLFQYLRQKIAEAAQDASECAPWLEHFSRRSKKRNAFWATYKNKKSGGEQYLFSGEHSAARSSA